MVKCVAYTRVSTDTKDQENSYENQQSYFKNRLGNAEGYELVGIFADKGLTGTKLNNRPSFNQMLHDAGIDIIETFTSNDRRLKKKHVLYEVSNREPKFNEIWIKNTSRFARNTLSFEIIKDLRKKGVHIYFVEQNLNTKDVASDFLLKLFQLFDEQESKDKSLKVSSGIREGARKGIINANSRLYGYEYIQAENRLEVIEEEAEVIRKIFNMYMNNFGIRRIINYLTVHNVNTRNGKPFCKSSIRRILTNEKYAGINARLKYDTGIVFSKNSYAKIRPKEQWESKKSDKIPVIVSEEQFNAVQDILEGKVNYQSQIGVYKGITELAGVLKCGKCGGNYNSNIDRGRRFYNCKTKKLRGIKECDNPNISLAKLKELITSDVYISLRYECMMQIVVEYKKMIDSRVEQINNVDVDRISELKEQLQKVNTKIDRLLDVYTDEVITKEMFIAKNAPLDIRKVEIEEELMSVSKPKEDLVQEITDIRTAIETMKSIEVKAEYTFEEIIADVESITVYPNRLVIDFKSFISNEHLRLDFFKGTITYK